MSVALQSIVIIIIFFPCKGMFVFTSCHKNCGPLQFRPSAAICKHAIGSSFLAKLFSALFKFTLVCPLLSGNYWPRLDGGKFKRVMRVCLCLPVKCFSTAFEVAHVCPLSSGNSWPGWDGGQFKRVSYHCKEELMMSQQSKSFVFLGGVQEGVEAQLANRTIARLSRQFVSPGLSNRLSHP